MRPGGEASYTFSTTGSPDDFATIGRRFLGSELLGATQFAGGRG
jgi:glutamate racemase